MSRSSRRGVYTFMDRDSELALVGRLRAGDEAAFDEVYDACHPRLLNFLTRLSRRRDLAEDLVEETWLRLVSHARRLRDDTRIEAWLFTVARNLYTSHCRARAIEERAADLIGLWPAPASGRSPFEETAANEADRRLEAALAALPFSAREVLLLVGIEEMAPAEAALVCGISPEALRQRLSRARKLLARELDRSATAGTTALLEVWP